jgi:hypothetical protein
MPIIEEILLILKKTKLPNEAISDIFSYYRPCNPIAELIKNEIEIYDNCIIQPFSHMCGREYVSKSIDINNYISFSDYKLIYLYMRQKIDYLEDRLQDINMEIRNLKKISKKNLFSDEYSIPQYVIFELDIKNKEKELQNILREEEEKIEKYNKKYEIPEGVVYY